MLPGEKFNELYNILHKIIINIAKEKEEVFIIIDYWNELARIDLRIKDALQFFHIKEYHDGVKLLVTEVNFPNGDPDYNYFMGNEPELRSWLIRPDVNRCIIELEKTIFMLS